MLKRKFNLGNREIIINASKGDGSTRSSDEVSVMEMERRG